MEPQVTIKEKHIQIVRFLSEGKKPKEIGELMEFSNRTVESYIDYLRNCFSCKTAAHLVAEFIRRKIIE